MNTFNEFDLNNLFHLACEYGYIQVVKYLVTVHKVDVGSDDNYAVRIAIECGHLEVVKYLVEKCGTNAIAHENCAFTFACMNDHLEVVKYLVEKCGVTKDNCSDAIIGICQFGNLKIVKYLIEKCVFIYRPDEIFGIPYALGNGHFEFVKYLVEKCNAILPPYTPAKYFLYLSICEKGETYRRIRASKKIYFWWVRNCYNPDSLCGHRSIYKGYREYLTLNIN